MKIVKIKNRRYFHEEENVLALLPALCMFADTLAGCGGSEEPNDAQPTAQARAGPLV